MCNTNIKHLIFIILTLVGSSIWAESPNFSQPPVLEVTECDLDAPTGFHITSYVGNHLGLAWNAVPRAVAYQLELRDYHTKQLVYRDTTHNTTRVLVLPYVGQFSVSVAAIGDGCPPSARQAVIEPVLPIINELVTAGYSAPNTCLLDRRQQYMSISVPVPAPGQMPIHRWYNIYQAGSFIGRFMVRTSSDPLGFSYADIAEDPACPNIKTKGAFISPNNPPSWTCVPNSSNSPVFITNARFSLEPECLTAPNDPYLFELFFPSNGDPGTIKIGFTYGDASIEFAQFMCSANPGDPGPGPDPNIGRDRSTTTTPQPQSITNPFTDELLIRFGEQPGSPTGIQLFNLNGQAVSDHITTTDQEYSIPTSTLPAGLYLLRIDAEGSRRTYKVVKAQ